MRILHISALPVWPMEGKGGMPSLRETLLGHVRAGHEIRLILPEYDLNAVKLTRLSSPGDPGYQAAFACCPWFPCLQAARAGFYRHVQDSYAL